MKPSNLSSGTVIAAHGRHYFVEDQSGEVRKCYTRGKRSGICVGDTVDFSVQSAEQGTIETVHPRRNLLYRSDEARSKQFAANIDQLLIVVASEPPFSEDLCGRALVAAEFADIAPIIILNKADLPSVEQARKQLKPLADLDVPIIELSALNEEQVKTLLYPVLENKCTLLLGQSGMGKSTLLNTLIPEAKAHTQTHSEALGTGRHTTTSTRLYHIPGITGDLIDSPGFQTFGLAHVEPSDIVRGFPEFMEELAHCKFYNCTHRHEPHCGIVDALKAGKIHPERYALYERLLAEYEAQSRY
ncbi:MAG: ribosome small subunit-dependent GTPase A [Paenalcaligenes sp.]